MALSCIISEIKQYRVIWWKNRNFRPTLLWYVTFHIMSSQFHPSVVVCLWRS